MVIRQIRGIKPKVKEHFKVESGDEGQEEAIEILTIEVVTTTELTICLVPQIPEKQKITETGA